MNVANVLRRGPALAVLGLVLLLAPAAPAQITGNFTIDSAQPASATNFTSFGQAIAALQNQGPALNVTFTVHPGSGPYQGFSIPGPISGVTVNAPVVFRAAVGTTPVIGLPPAGGNELVRLGPATITSGGPAGIVLDGIELDGAPQSAAIMAIGCQGISIRNCRIHDCGSGIAYMGCSTGLIEGNEIWNCGTTIAAPGVAMLAAPIAVTHQSSEVQILGNRLHDVIRKGIQVSGPSGVDSPSLVVANNFIRDVVPAAFPGAAIEIQNSSMSTISFNSIRMGPLSTDPALQLNGSPGAPIARVTNNVIRHEGSGWCLRITSSPLSLLFPGMLDYNLYDPGFFAAVAGSATADFQTLADWRAVASTVNASFEANSLSGSAGFASPSDLHLLPCSLGFASGESVPGITTDIDGDPRPQLTAPCRGADEVVLAGPCAGFTVSAVSGERPLRVTFTDQSQTPVAGGIVAWGWDFQGDGVIDSTAQNPTWTYTKAGSYSVVLTVADSNGTLATTVRPNLVIVTAPQLTLSNPMPGSGLLQIDPVPGLAIPGAWRGYTFLSFNTATPVGGGGWFGITPDVLTLITALVPVSPDNILHYYVAPGLFPETGPVSAGPYPWLVGLTLDAVQVFVGIHSEILEISNVSRVTM